MSDTPSDGTEESRQRILRVAARLFRETGYAGVSMRRIADAGGLTAGSLYHHFASKDDIVATILDLGIDLVHRSVGQALADSEGQPPGTRLRKAIRAHLDALFAHGDFTSANVRIFGQLPGDLQARNLKARHRYERLWDAFLLHLRAEGYLRQDVDVKNVRLLWIGAMNATLEWFDPDQGPLNALADQYGDLLVNGILAEPKGCA